MRAVLDPNVLIASLLSKGGAPAQIVFRWLAGEFELVVSEALLAEHVASARVPSSRSPRPSEQSSSRGDRHLHALAGRLPVLAPRAFLDQLAEA